MRIFDAYRAVVFDFFGTLTHAVQRGPYHTTIAYHLGCDPGEFFEVLNRSFFDRSRGRYGGAEDTLRWVCAQQGAAPPSTRLRAACTARVAALRADTRLRPEAVPLLRTLRRRGLRTAVVSDCGYELPEFLPTLPVAGLLDATVYSVEVGQCKPHPAMYHTAAARLGVAPEECLYVGDGGSRELTGARAAGMTAIRLAAPDLGNHLAFETEHEWDGLEIESLAELAAARLRTPAMV